MTKHFTFFLILLFSFTSCGNPNLNLAWFEKDEKPAVLCTTEMIHDLVKEVGQEHIKTLALISHGLDPHTYELVKGDDEKLSGADLIFYNGLSLEHGSSLKYALENHKNSVALGDWIAENHPQSIIYHNSTPDPHIWMDVSLFSKTVAPIVEALSKALPEKKDFFEKNGFLLDQKLQMIHEKVKEKFDEIAENKRYLVTTHDAFHYFARAYLSTEKEIADGTWKIRCKAPEGLAPDGQISLAEMEDLLSHIKKYHITSLFAEASINQDSLRKLVMAGKEQGLNISIPHETLYSDSMGGKGSPVETYFEMIPYNGTIISSYVSKNGGY